MTQESRAKLRRWAELHVSTAAGTSLDQAREVLDLLADFESLQQRVQELSSGLSNEEP